MYSVEESIKELKEQVAKLDNLIKMGETYIHMFNEATKDCTMDDVPADIQEDYLGIIKDIAESRMLKHDLEALLHLSEMIVDHKKMYADRDQERAEREAEDNE